MGVQAVRRENYEADDIIGSILAQNFTPSHRSDKLSASDLSSTSTASASASAPSTPLNLILSADKDYTQLLTYPSCLLLRPLPSQSFLIYGVDSCEREYGIHPRQFIDYLTMVGDAVDGIPGVDGIGKATAAKLLKQFGNLEGILTAAREAQGKTTQGTERPPEKKRNSKKKVTDDQHSSLSSSLNSSMSDPVPSLAASLPFPVRHISALLSSSTDLPMYTRLASIRTDVFCSSSLFIPLSWLTRQHSDGVRSIQNVWIRKRERKVVKIR